MSADDEKWRALADRLAEVLALYTEKPHLPRFPIHAEEALQAYDEAVEAVEHTHPARGTR